MPIAPTRFKINDKETNVVVTDFRKLKDSDILNSAVKGLATITAVVETVAGIVQGKNLQNALKNIAAGVVGNVVSSVVSSASEYVSRITADGLSTINTLCSNGIAAIDKVAGPLLEGMEPVKAILRSVDPAGYNQILSNSLNISNSLSTLNIGGNLRNIPAGLTQANQYINLVNTLSGGRYPATVTNTAATERLLTSVTRQTASIGMTGVFTALSGSINDRNSVFRSAVNLIDLASKGRNTNLLLEISNSPIANQLRQHNPTIANAIIKGVEIGKRT